MRIYTLFLLFGKMQKLSERKVNPESLFHARSCKILASYENLPRFLQQSCKNAIASKNLARIEFFVGILQDFLNLQETCKILQKLFFLTTRALMKTYKQQCVVNLGYFEQKLATV